MSDTIPRHQFARPLNWTGNGYEGLAAQLLDGEGLWVEFYSPTRVDPDFSTPRRTAVRSVDDFTVFDPNAHQQTVVLGFWALTPKQETLYHLAGDSWTYNPFRRRTLEYSTEQHPAHKPGPLHRALSRFAGHKH